MPGRLLTSLGESVSPQQGWTFVKHEVHANSLYSKKNKMEGVDLENIVAHLSNPTTMNDVALCKNIMSKVIV